MKRCTSATPAGVPRSRSKQTRAQRQIGRLLWRVFSEMPLRNWAATFEQQTYPMAEALFPSWRDLHQVFDAEAPRVEEALRSAYMFTDSRPKQP